MSKPRKPKVTLKKEKKASTVRIPRSGIGTTGISFYQDVINRIAPYELKWPQSMRTYEVMKYDDAISTVLNYDYTLIEGAWSRYTVKYKKGSEKSKAAADFVRNNLETLEGQTFLQTIRNAETFKEKGFSILEKVYRKELKGEYAGLWKLSQLANRPQASLDQSQPFEVTNGGRRIVAARQNTQYFQNYHNNNLFIDPNENSRGRGYKLIPRKKFILFGENATDSTPFGTPVLKACYKLWKEKVLLEDLEVNGASKDLAGIIELAIPADILDIAHSDPTSPEYLMVQDLLITAANVHAGEQPYFVRPSDLQEGSSSVSDFGIKLLGLEGSGRQFDPSGMIQNRRKAIFDVWGAGHALTGEGASSYNSAEVKNASHLHYIKRDIKVIEDGLNKDMLPQLLNVMNEFDLTVDEMPKIVAGEIDKASYDEVSKMVQRIISVGGFVPTKDNIIYYHQLLNFDTSLMEAMTEEELIKSMGSLVEGKTRAGESNGTSGTGNTQNSTGGDNNMENKSTSPYRVDSVGVYKTKGDVKVYFDPESLPEELRDGFNLKG